MLDLDDDDDDDDDEDDDDEEDGNRTAELGEEPSFIPSSPKK